MSGYRYVLVDRQLADFLRAVGVERIGLEPAALWSPSTQVDHRSYERLTINQWFSADQVNDLNLYGDRLLTLGDEFVFASPSLKEKLEKAGFVYLQFTEGLRGWAGDVA